MFETRVVVSIKIAEEKDLRRWMEKSGISILSGIAFNIVESWEKGER